MNYKVFYRKYRPDSFQSIVGQEYTKNMLQNAINKIIYHMLIFYVGKQAQAKELYLMQSHRQYNVKTALMA